MKIKSIVCQHCGHDAEIMVCGFTDIDGYSACVSKDGEITSSDGEGFEIESLNDIDVKKINHVEGNCMKCQDFCSIIVTYENDTTTEDAEEVLRLILTNNEINIDEMNTDYQGC